MVSFFQKDLFSGVVLSLVGLAFIWLIPVSYPFTLIPYLLLLFLPGYALITLIKPHNGFVVRVVMGFLLSVLFTFYIPVVFSYLNLTFLDVLISSLLFLVTILFCLLALYRRRRISPFMFFDDDERALEEAITRIKRIKNLGVGYTFPSGDIGNYFMMPNEAPSLKNMLSVMLIYDMVDMEIPQPGKSLDKNPIKRISLDQEG